MNTELRAKAKNDFEKDFFKLTNSSVFGKTMENVRKNRDIKLVITDKRRNYLALEPNYRTVAMEMIKINIKINKSVYFGLSVLDISKTVMLNDYAKPKYVDNARL